MKKLISLFCFFYLFLTSFLLAQNQSIGNPPDWNWIETVGGSAFDHGQSIVGDAQGNFFIAGDFSGNTQFDNNNLTTQGLLNGFVTKCDPTGAVLWITQFKSTSLDGKVIANSVALDPNGDLFVLGNFRGGDLQVGNQTFNLSTPSSLFLAKFGPAGTLLWLKTQGVNSSAGITYGKLLADSDGSVYALTNRNLQKFNSTGNQVWEQPNQSESNADISLLGNTLLYAGVFSTDIQLGNETLTTPVKAFFKAKVNRSSGAFSDASVLAESPTFTSIQLNSIALINETDFFLLAAFVTTLNIGSFTLNSGLSQYCVAKFESNACTWAIQSTGNGVSSYFSARAQVLSNAVGDAILFGNKANAITFENNTVDGGTNGFLAKINGNTGTLVSLADQPFFNHGWTDGQNILQTGSPNYNVIFRKTNDVGITLIDRSFESDSGFGIVTSSRKDNTGVYILANVAGNSLFLGQEDFYPESSIAIWKLNFAGNAILWKQIIPGASSVFSYGHSLWLDQVNSNLYIVGSFLSPFEFGGQTVGTTDGGVFVAQMGVDGSFGWIKTFPINVEVTSVITDYAGDVLINGSFTDNLQIGNTTLHSAGVYDIFWAKLNASGQVLFAQRMGGENDDYESYSGVDQQGNFYMVGQYFSYNIDFNGTNQTTRVDGDGIFYHLKFAPDGQILWIKNFGNTDQPGLEYYCFASNIAVDSAGNSYIIGLHGKSNFFGPIHLESPYSVNNFVSKISPEGNPLWAKSIRTKASSFNYCEVGLDELGDCYIGGQFRDSIYFDGALLTRVGNQDAYIAKVGGNDGATVWVKTISGPGGAIVFPVTISVFDKESLFVGGHLNDRVNFDATSFNTYGGRQGFLALIGQDISVSIKQPAPGSFILSIAPNPTVKEITISSPDQEAKNLFLEIFNSTGSLVISKNVADFKGETSLDLSIEPVGIYFLKVTSTTGQQLIRIVKQ